MERKKKDMGNVKTAAHFSSVQVYSTANLFLCLFIGKMLVSGMKKGPFSPL